MPRRLAVLYNHDENLAAGAARDRAAVQAVRACADAVATAASEGGYEPELVRACGDPGELARRLRAARPDVVFNLCEALEGDPRLEVAAAWMLELLRLPYTGCRPAAIGLCLEKPVAKSVLLANGVSVPLGQTLATGDERIWVESPRYIVKPSREDASHGISSRSVVASPAEARALAREIVAEYHQPALLEEFIDGREVNVAILESEHGPRILPPSEIDYTSFPPELPRIVSYAAKWDPHSPEWKHMPVVPMADAGDAAGTALKAMALQAWRVLGLSGYARIDFRLHATRGAFVLEANPNPDLSPDAGFATSAARAGIGYADLVGRIVERASATGPDG
jgi:D-alanine-D-alanine ligase